MYLKKQKKAISSHAPIWNPDQRQASIVFPSFNPSAPLIPVRISARLELSEAARAVFTGPDVADRPTFPLELETLSTRGAFMKSIYDFVALALFDKWAIGFMNSLGELDI